MVFYGDLTVASVLPAFRCAETALRPHRATRVEGRVRSRRGCFPSRTEIGVDGGIRERPPTSRLLLECDRLSLALAAMRHRVSLPLARAARALARRKSWSAFGYARMNDYARERLRRSGRWFRDLAALGDALDKTPRLASALTGDDGGPPIGRVAAHLIGRLVIEAAAAEPWIALARAVSIRDLREAIARARERGSEWPVPAETPEGRTGAEALKAHASGSPGDVGAGACEGAANDGGAAAVVDGAGDVRDDAGGGRITPRRGVACANDEATEASVTVSGLESHGTPPVVDDDPHEDRCLVRILVPQAVKAAFDEALDLHGAVCGEETSVTSFVEALVAEAHAGPHPPDAEMVPLRARPGPEIVEKALARATENWSHLAEDHGCPDIPPDASRAQAESGSDPIQEARNLLSRIQGICEVAGTGDDTDVDRQLRALIAFEDEIELRLGRLLAEMRDRGAWARLLFAGAGHYGEQRLGLCRTSAEDRACLARALHRLPALRDAYELGRIGLEASLLVLRALGSGPVDAEEERAWVRRAEEVTVKRLRDEVRELVRRAAADAGCARVPAPDDAAWHGSLNRAPGTARARVACFGRAASSARHPDVFLRLRLPWDLAGSFLEAIESRRRRLAEQVESVPWYDEWPDRDASGSVLAARTFSTACRRIPSWVGVLALIEEFVAEWDDPARSPRRAADAVYIRAGWRCTAPGCTSRRNLEDHHLIYRSRGGQKKELFNRTCLCAFHHRQGEHGELASCKGRAPLAITWRLGRNGIGGRFRNERRLA